MPDIWTKRNLCYSYCAYSYIQYINHMRSIKYNTNHKTCKSGHFSWTVLYDLYIIVFYWVYVLVQYYWNYPEQ